MKKKFFASLMAMVMVFGLAACGGSSDTTTTEGDAAEGGTGGKIGVSMPTQSLQLSLIHILYRPRSDSVVTRYGGTLCAP